MSSNLKSEGCKCLIQTMNVVLFIVRTIRQWYCRWFNPLCDDHSFLAAGATSDSEPMSAWMEDGLFSRPLTNDHLGGDRWPILDCGGWSMNAVVTAAGCRVRWYFQFVTSIVGLSLRSNTRKQPRRRIKTPETNSYAQALATHCVGFLLYPSSAELPYAK